MPEQNQAKPSRRSARRSVQLMMSPQSMLWQRVSLVLILGGGVGSAFLLVAALITGVWQLLVGAIGLVAGLAVLGVALRRLRQGKTTQAGYLTLLAIGIVSGAPIGFWTGITPLLIISGMLAMIFLADLLLPDQRWRAMLVSLVSFAAYCVLALALPLPRYDVSQITIIPIFLLGLVAVVVGALGLQVIYTLRFGSFRARLLIAFIALMLFPITLVGILAGSIYANNNRERALNQMAFAATLKEEEVSTWLNQLRSDLSEVADAEESAGPYLQVLTSPSASAEFAAASQSLRDSFKHITDYHRDYEAVSVMTPDGNVVLSTDPRELTRNYSRDEGLQVGLQQTYLAPPELDRQTNRFFINVYTPLFDQAKTPIGVLVGRVNSGELAQLMSARAGLDTTGETYLVKSNGAAVTQLRYGSLFSPVQSDQLRAGIAAQAAGSGVYASYHNTPVYAAWRWLPELQAALVAEEASSEITHATDLVTTAIIVVALIVIGLAVVGAVLSTRNLATPIEQLEQTAGAIAAGDLQQRSSIEREDEVGSLAHSINTITTQLQSLTVSLDERVQARTEQLRTSAEVGRKAVSVLQPDRLLREIVNLIAERFGFYYVAIFTLDQTGQYAVLREASGETGRILKEQGHQLEVGGQSMVGFVTAHRRPRIALDVGDDAVRFANPLLPNTRSEIALPLLMSDHVLGALDVQSTAEAAFDETSATLLQSMADQVAIALNNALSFAESEAVIQRSRVLLAASHYVNDVQADLKSVVDAMLRTISIGLKTDRWWVVTFDAERANLVPISTNAWLATETAISVLEQGSNPLVRCAVQSEQFIINQPLTDARLQGLNTEQRAGLGKFIAVPIIQRDLAMGALAIGRPNNGEDLQEADLETANGLASLLAVALENHRLSEAALRAQHELAALNQQVIGEDWSAFARKRSRRGVMWFSTGEDYTALPEVGEALAQSHVVTRPLADNNQLGIAVPIVLRDTSLGAFRLVVPRQRWNEEMLATLESIAGHVAQAAENVRLLSVTEERFARERALGEATDRVRRRTEIESILETAATELARYLNASRVAVHLGADSERADGNE